MEKYQKNLKSNLNEITTENSKSESKDKLNIMKNIKDLYESREKVIKLYNDYGKIKCESKFRSKHGTGLKIVTSKQMLQILPIALVEVKAGNNSESLLNEIRQIIYSLYQSKEITKKLYNNMIKSIKV